MLEDTSTQFGPAASLNIHASQEHHKVELQIDIERGTLKFAAGNKIYPKADVTIFLGHVQMLSLIGQFDTAARQLEAALGGALE